MALWMFYNSVLTSPEPEVDSITFNQLINRLSAIYHSYAFQSDHDAIYHCWNDPEEAARLKKEAKRFRNLEDLCYDMECGEKDYQKCPTCFYEHFMDADEEHMLIKYREKFFHSDEAQKIHLEHGPAPQTEGEEEEDEELELNEDGNEIGSVTYSEIIDQLKSKFVGLRADYQHDAMALYWGGDIQEADVIKQEGKIYEYLIDLCDLFKQGCKAWDNCPICFYENFKLLEKEGEVEQYHKLFHCDMALEKHLDHHIPIEEWRAAEEKRHRLLNN